MNLAIRHRLSAFSDAIGQVGDRTAFITGAGQGIGGQGPEGGPYLAGGAMLKDIHQVQGRSLPIHQGPAQTVAQPVEQHRPLPAAAQH